MLSNKPTLKQFDDFDLFIIWWKGDGDGLNDGISHFMYCISQDCQCTFKDFIQSHHEIMCGFVSRCLKIKENL